MASRKVKEVIKMFRSRFKTEDVQVPLSLRQESPDVVFRALLEEDADPMGDIGPMMGFEPEMPMMGGMDQMGALMEQAMGQPAVMGQSPMGPAQPQGGAAAGGVPDLDQILGMM